MDGSSVYQVDYLDQLCLKVSLGLLGASFGSVIERWLLESLGICLHSVMMWPRAFSYVFLESEVGEQKT